MNSTEATSIIHNALIGYVEDCAGAGSEEANTIQKAWDLIKGNLPEEDRFPNGFTSWHETHAEICAIISERLANYVDYREEEHVIFDTQDEMGRGGMYELAKSWTDEFELLFHGKEWDGEFFDEVENFVNRKNANQ